MEELALKACLSGVYEAGDFIELVRPGQGAPIARSIAFDLFKMTTAATS
jgi:hypothetical protein